MQQKVIPTQKWKANAAGKVLRLVKACENWSGQILKGWLYVDFHLGLKFQLDIPSLEWNKLPLYKKF